MEGAGEGPSSSPSTRLTRCPSSASRAMVAERVEREAGQGWYFPCQGGGALSWPSSTPRCPLTVRGHLAPLPQVGGEGPEAAPDVHQLPAASCGRGAEVGAWHPPFPPDRTLCLPPAYRVRNVPHSISPDV